MAAPPAPGPPGVSPDAGERLESWKEIASYLGRTTRTVQRWEREDGLPVHRLRLDRQGSVYALRSEIDAWWRERSQGPEPFDAGDAVESHPPEASALPAISRKQAAAAGIAILLGLIGFGAWLGTRDAPRPPTAAGGPERIRLAVLPLRNVSGDPANDYLSDGLTEDLITGLGRANPSQLGVIARSSVVSYAGLDDALERAARELGVHYALEGSVGTVAGSLRVSVRLVRLADHLVAWAESFDRDVAELPAVEAAVVLDVARTLALPLATPARPLPASEDAEAHAAFLRGRFQANKRTPDGLRDAVSDLEGAAARAPGSARIWSALADALSLSANYGVLEPTLAYPRAREAVDRALALDPESGDAHASLAFILRNYDWDLPGAEREFLAALARNPNDARAWNWYALHLAGGGRFAEAREAIGRALEVDPVAPATLARAANVEFLSGRYEEAIRRQRTLLQLDPDNVNARLDLGRSLAQLGQWDDALHELGEASRLSGEHPMALAVIGNVQARAGRMDEARATLAALLAREPATYVAPYYKAVLYAGLGETATAVRWLEAVRDSRHVGVLSIAVEPELASLRSDAAFQKLLREIGLPTRVVVEPS